MCKHTVVSAVCLHIEHCVAAAYVCTTVYHVSPTALLRRELRAVSYQGRLTYSALTSPGAVPRLDHRRASSRLVKTLGVPPRSQIREYPTHRTLPAGVLTHFIRTRVRRLDAATTEFRGVGQLCRCLWLESVGVVRGYRGLRRQCDGASVQPRVLLAGRKYLALFKSLTKQTVTCKG